MDSFRKLFVKPLVIKILIEVLAVFGCLLFLLSFISPIYSVRFLTLAGFGSTTYWSYKGDYENQITIVHHSRLYWFSDYWFNSTIGLLGVGTPWILTSMFVLQVLTLAFGVVYIILRRRILLLALVLLSLSVMALMIFTGEILSQYALTEQGEYQLGYYLIFPSVILFLSAFALNEVMRKLQTARLAKENPSTLSPLMILVGIVLLYFGWLFSVLPIELGLLQAGTVALGLTLVLIEVIVPIARILQERSRNRNVVIEHNN
jgi:hypothetical protein